MVRSLREIFINFSKAGTELDDNNALGKFTIRCWAHHIIEEHGIRFLNGNSVGLFNILQMEETPVDVS